ncbi:hypothetical protein ACOSQ2_025200 [Xanthoceras sorbifolium]|uniref:Protein kinase domain-containing protein n=1 Tax=Xanthoceras sorbifolium TaxID=99658 RepID=A0ABQ8H0C0_9ROSI|nr:hypothetical protein JRO89_XSUnG0018900 [Xanthoceras sorbifolium]
MAAALRSLYFWILFILSFSTLALAQDQNQFIYNGFHEAKLHLGGIATIHPNGLLQLTNTSERQKGYAFYPSPIKFNTSSSQSLLFSTYFVFGMVPGSLNFSGHGMTFVISPSMDFSEATATAYLGLFNTSNNGLLTNHVLAVELDTVVSPEFKDLDGEHVGIDVNSLISNESALATYFSDSEGKNKSLKLVTGNQTQIWIDYNGAEKLLNVTLAPISVPKPSRPLLSTVIDLSQILLESMYVGFTASTGTIANDHYVLGWSFNRSGKADNLDVSKLPSLPPPPPLSIPSKKGRQIPDSMIIVLVVALSVVLLTIGGAVCIVRKKKYEEIYEGWEREYGPQRISYKNLYKATKGFKDKELIGEGGFGKVYRGVLSSSDQIAVKRVCHNSGQQAMKQFVAEVVSMGRLRHRNLVQLRGYCRRKGELLLVYDYMPNGSLDKVLYSNIRPNLNWFQRIRILRGVASGLLYLHEDWEQIVLHRDIKPGNILLDADLNGKLGDFGLARLYDHGSIPQTTNLVGTVGYLAPEFLRTGKATTSTDVFAFGVFMLEVACGRKPIEPAKVDLVDWVIDCWNKRAILDASDPRLEGLYVEEQLELVLKLGLFCSHPNPDTRPSMRQVMQYLDGDAKFDVSPNSNLLDAFRASYNEASNTVMPFASLFENSSSSHTMSTIDSILNGGR